MTLQVNIIPILNDNYAYHLVAETNNEQFHAIIDPGEAQPILNYIAQHNIALNAIINTHYHWDHTDGNAEIAAQTGAQIWAPNTSGRINNITKPLNHNDQIIIAGYAMHIIATPGHTSDHICLYFPDDHIIFTGDTLFSMGCGRIFDSNPNDFFNSLEKIKQFPPQTLIYPGHEYTLSNAAFCLHHAPENHDIQTRAAQVQNQRENSIPTIPTTLAEELKTNLFLQTKNAEQFTKLRIQKDNF